MNFLWTLFLNLKLLNVSASWLVGWLGFTACQPIGSFYAEYIFIYELTLFMNNFLQTQVLVYLTHRWDPNRCYHSFQQVETKKYPWKY